MIPDIIVLSPEDAELFGQKYGHPRVYNPSVGDPNVVYRREDKMKLKWLTINREKIVAFNGNIQHKVVKTTHSLNPFMAYSGSEMHYTGSQLECIKACQAYEDKL